MSLETGIYKLLSANSAVAALVGTRIYPVIVPEGATFPAVVYQRIDTARNANTFDNSAELPVARMQITCWAENFADVVSLQVAVQNVLAGFHGLADDTTVQACLVSDMRDTWEYEISTVGLFRRDVDFEIAYEE